jgi:hypothetical protein
MSLTRTRPTFLLAAVGLSVLAMVGCNGSSNGAGRSTPPPSASVESTAPIDGETARPSAPAGPVTTDQAGNIATGKYGGTVIEIEPDSYHGEATWEVEVKNSSQGRIEVDVSKQTGAIVSLEHEDD